MKIHLHLTIALITLALLLHLPRRRRHLLNFITTTRFLPLNNKRLLQSQPRRRKQIPQDSHSRETNSQANKKSQIVQSDPACEARVVSVVVDGGD